MEMLHDVSDDGVFFTLPLYDSTVDNPLQQHFGQPWWDVFDDPAFDAQLPLLPNDDVPPAEAKTNDLRTIILDGKVELDKVALDEVSKAQSTGKNDAHPSAVGGEVVLQFDDSGVTLEPPWLENWTPNDMKPTRCVSSDIEREKIRAKSSFTPAHSPLPRRYASEKQR